MPASASTSAPLHRGPIAGPLPVRYVMAGLAFTLLGGTALGAVYLALTQGFGRAQPLTHVQAHAHAQLFGLFGCLLAGFGLQLLPRFVRVAVPFPRLAAAHFWLLVTGVACHFIGQPGTRWEPGFWLMLASAPLMSAAAACFAINVFALCWRARDEAWARAVMVGTLMLCAGMALDGVLAARLFAYRERLYESSQAQALWTLAQYGGVLLFTAGVAARMLPAFAGGAPIKPRSLNATITVLTLGVLAQTAAWGLPYSITIRPFALALGRGTIGLGMVMLVAVFARSVFGAKPAVHDRVLVTGVRFAFSFLAIAGALRLGAAVVEIALGRPVDLLVHDAERHLMTVGFLLLLTVSVGLRLVPGLLGVPPKWTRLRLPILALLVASAVARSAQVGAAFGLRSAGHISAASGGLAWLALALFAAVVIATARSRRASWQAALRTRMEEVTPR